MADLLLEIGTEELPASFVRPATAFLEKAAAGLLDEAHLTHGDIRCDGTPRRLVLVVRNVLDKQEDRSFEVTGPKAEIAWGKDGQLSKAGLGFLKGRGAGPDDAYKKETKKGAVIAAQVTEVGKPAGEVLAPALEALLPKIPFQKRMRWTDGPETFGRPVRWLVAKLGDQVLPMSFAGVAAQDQSRGHRFCAPEPFVVTSVDGYLQDLKAAKVTLSFDERRQLIADKARALAKEAGGVFREDDDLLDTVANLVEHPWPILAKFDERFLEVPKEVLISEMREHQKYFAIEDKDGWLLPYFVVVAGSEATDPAQVAAGHRRVLTSRFEDGAFYFREDQKTTLAARAEKLKTVMFQRDLGSVADKVDRIGALTGWLADAAGLSADEKKTAQRAAALSKADLVSGVVGEFPDLQGHMGRIYAKLDKEPEAVAEAIAEHYAPRGRGDALPASKAGAAVAIADRLDTLVGILGVGKAPKGSADPFGLRRAAIGALEIVLHHGFELSVSALVDQAVAGLPDDVQNKTEDLRGQANAFVRARMAGVLAERLAAAGHEEAQDLVEAALSAGADNAVDAALRAEALGTLRGRDRDGFLALAATFKRVGNILKKARADKVDIAAQVDEGKLGLEPEKALYAATQKMRAVFDGPLSDAAAYEKALVALAEQKAVVDAFFDGVMVMDDDPAVRAQRLGLLAGLEALLVKVADFTRIQDVD